MSARAAVVRALALGRTPCWALAQLSSPAEAAVTENGRECCRAAEEAAAHQATRGPRPP